MFIKRLLPIAMTMVMVMAGITAGCQWLPDRTPEAVTAEEHNTMDGAETSPERVRLPNPYLEDQPDVPTEARERFAAAQAALAQQSWETAEIDLLWLTKNYPKFSGPFLNLALLYIETGRSEKAEPVFKQAIAANARNIDAYNEYGIFLREQGRFAEAEAIYLKALEVWPDSTDTRMNLGILYDLYLGKFEQALTQYRAYQALQNEPDRRVQGWIVDIERRQAH